MKFPYFGKFSYYAIFSKNNTIVDIRVPIEAFKRRKKSYMKGTLFYITYI